MEWHKRRQLDPLLSQDGDPAAAQAKCETPVEPAQVSERAQRMAASKTTESGLTVHSFPTLLADLASLVRNPIRLPTQPQIRITIATAQQSAAPDPRPARRRLAAEFFHNGDRLRAVSGYANPHERNRLCNEYGPDRL